MAFPVRKAQRKELCKKLEKQQRPLEIGPGQSFSERRSFCLSASGAQTCKDERERERTQNLLGDCKLALIFALKIIQLCV